MTRASSHPLPVLLHHSSAPPPLEVVTVEKTAPKSRGCLRDALLASIAILAGAALALLALFLLNGTLNFGRTAPMIALKSQVAALTDNSNLLTVKMQEQAASLKEVEKALDKMDSQVSELQQQAGTLDTRLGNLETQSTDTADESADLAADLSALTQTTTQMRADIAALNTQLSELAAAARPAGAIVTSTLTTTNPISSPALERFPPGQPIPTVEPGASHILGLVWVENDGDGIPEQGEQPLPNAIIRLRDARGRQLLELSPATTDATCSPTSFLASTSSKKSTRPASHPSPLTPCRLRRPQTASSRSTSPTGVRADKSWRRL